MTMRVTIVGGGVIGVASAWYLTQRGVQCTVVDRAKIGGACSRGNCGLICPSHVLPLTEPGAFKEALKAMVSPGTPFRVRPRVDRHLWSWMWNFARRCNRPNMLQAASAIQAMLKTSMDEYQSLMSTDGFSCEWQKRGLLFVYRSRSALESYKETNQLLADQFDEPATMLGREEVTNLEPALRDDVAGGWHYEHDAHLRPDRLMAQWRMRLEQLGCEFIEDSPVNRVDAERAIVFAGNREITGDKILFASGAWSPKLVELIGCRVPIEPGKGYSITMPRPSICPQIPIIFPEHRVAVTPMESGYRLGSIMEFSGWDETIKPERLALLKDGAKHYLQEPYCDPVEDTWFGWRPMTYDSVPVIDRSPTRENIWVATGHNMLGLSMATGTGRLVSELLTDSSPHIDPKPYSLSRFG